MCQPAPARDSPDWGGVASVSRDRPALGRSSLNFFRSWGLTSCSLAAARRPKWGLVSAGRPAASPTLGVWLPRGSSGTPGKGKGETTEVKGGHWAPCGHPGLAAKGHKPLGMSDPLTWDGRGQLAGRGVHSQLEDTRWRGFSPDRHQPGICLVRGFIDPNRNVLAWGPACWLPTRWPRAVVGSPAPAPHRSLSLPRSCGCPCPLPTPTEELQCGCGLLPALLALVNDGEVAVVRLHPVQVPLLLCC